MKLRSQLRSKRPSCARRRRGSSARHISPRRQASARRASIGCCSGRILWESPATKTRHDLARRRLCKASLHLASFSRIRTNQISGRDFRVARRPIFSWHLTSLRLPTMVHYDRHCTIICISQQSVTCHPVAATIAHCRSSKIARLPGTHRRSPERDAASKPKKRSKVDQVQPVGCLFWPMKAPPPLCVGLLREATPHTAPPLVYGEVGRDGA